MNPRPLGYEHYDARLPASPTFRRVSLTRQRHPRASSVSHAVSPVPSSLVSNPLAEPCLELRVSDQSGRTARSAGRSDDHPGVRTISDVILPPAANVLNHRLRRQRIRCRRAIGQRIMRSVKALRTALAAAVPYSCCAAATVRRARSGMVVPEKSNDPCKLIVSALTLPRAWRISHSAPTRSDRRGVPRR